MNKELKTVLTYDSKANSRSSIRTKLFGDEVWKFIVSMRKLEHYSRQMGIARIISIPGRSIWKIRYHRYSIKLGFSIPVNVLGKGLGLPHHGTIVISKYAQIGDGCRIHEGVTIGATNGTKDSPVIGKNVFIGSGAKIIGNVKIADGVAIGANAVVTKDISEPETTWGGIPAKKISDEASYSNLVIKI